MFTGTIILYMLIAAIMGQESASLITLLGLLIISSVGTLIQYLCFTQNIIKKMRYTGRLFLFLLLFLPVLTACALTLHWFPPQYALGWLIFIGIFLLVFAAMTLGFEIFYRVTGKNTTAFWVSTRGIRKRKHADDGIMKKARPDLLAGLFYVG